MGDYSRVADQNEAGAADTRVGLWLVFRQKRHSIPVATTVGGKTPAEFASSPQLSSGEALPIKP
jgi:hypothetical protein